MKEAKSQEGADYVGLLKSVFYFLLDAGADLSDIRAIADRAISEAAQRNKRTSHRDDIDLAIASRVLDSWHRNNRYIDDNAKPKAIPLYGRAPSVEALVKLENGSRNPVDFVRRLRSSGFLLRSAASSYKPVARIAVVGGINPLIQQYVAHSSAMLLRTIRYNASASRRRPRLIERFAEVPDLPARYVAEFREFTQEQGWAMLRTVNDWLELRRARRTGKSGIRTVRAGLHLYAYMDSGQVKPRSKR